MTQCPLSHKSKSKKIFRAFVPFVYKRNEFILKEAPHYRSAAASLRLMAFSLNRAQLIGNLTRDPEIRDAGGHKVATFGVATSFAWKDQSGIRKEKTEFHNIVAWRKLAEICEQYLRKGSKVYIDGRIQTRDWEGEDGVKRYRTEILIENMIMLDKKGATLGGPLNAADDSGSSFQPPREQRNIKEKKSAAESNKEASQPEEEEVSIDDLPF